MLSQLRRVEISLQRLIPISTKVQLDCYHKSTLFLRSHDIIIRVCSVSIPRNENENKNKFDGIRTVPAVAKLSNTVTQCLSVNLWELIALSTLHYASSSTRNMAVTIITSCSICYKCYWCCYYPLCFPFVLVLLRFFTARFLFYLYRTQFSLKIYVLRTDV